MSRRRYDQACSIAVSLDRVGERWSLLVVRELLLGPLRFSELSRAVGGAPTDILTRRLRDLEADGIVRRVELGPPTGATVYELTEVGRELQGPLVALGRWGLNFYELERLAGIKPGGLPGPLLVAMRPPPTMTASLQLRSEGVSTWVKIEAGEMSAGRGELDDPDLTITGPPAAVLLALARGGAAEDPVEIEGDRELPERLRAHIELPERLADEMERAAAQLSSVPS